MNVTFEERQTVSQLYGPVYFVNKIANNVRKMCDTV